MVTKSDFILFTIANEKPIERRYKQIGVWPQRKGGKKRHRLYMRSSCDILGRNDLKNFAMVYDLNTQRK